MAKSYSIEAVFKLIDKVTAPTSNATKALDKLGIKSKAVGNALKNDFDKAAAQIDKLEKSMGKWAKRTALAGIAATGAIAGKSVKDAVEFQTALAKVSTIADTTAVPLKKLSKEIMGVSGRMGIAAGEIAGSTYTAISAGINTESATAFTEIAAKAAIAGYTDTATAIDGLSSALNAYNLPAEKAVDISDQMLIAQNLGKTSFGAMSQTMGKVIPIASNLNVSTKELFASVAALTNQAIQTPEAMTGLKAAFSNIMKPSDAAAKMAQRLGIDFSAAALKSKGWAAFLKDIGRVTRGDTAILSKLFKSTEAVNTILALTGSGAEKFSEALEEMDSAAGLTEKAFNIMMDTPEKRWAKALNTMKNAGINLGTSLLPVVEKVIEKISGIADRLSQIDFEKYTSAFESAFDKASGVIDTFAGMVWGAAKIAWQFRYVIAAILGPIAVYHLALMAAIPIIGLFTKLSFLAALTMGTQATALGMLKKGTVEYLVVDKLFTAATAVRNFVLNLLTGGTLAQTAATAKMAVATGTATKGQWLLNAAMTANPIGLVIGVILVLILVLKELFSNWDNIKKAFQDGGILAGILRIGGTIVSAILGPIQALLELLSRIPGLGDLAGKGADKIQEFRNFLKGTSDIANTAQNRKATEKPPTDEIDELLKKYEVDIPGLGEYPDFDIPGLGDYPGFDIPGIGEKSKLHGVVDISGGAIPTVDGSGSYTATNALDNASGPGTATSALTSYVLGISATLQRIEGAVSNIVNRIPPVVWAELPAIRAPATATGMSPLSPRINMGGGGADNHNPRNIPPITQAERMAYGFEERRETIVIEVAAEKGTAARVVRAPRDVDIRLVTSGGNR